MSGQGREPKLPKERKSRDSKLEGNFPHIGILCACVCDAFFLNNKPPFFVNIPRNKLLFAMFLILNQNLSGPAYIFRV